MKLLLDENLSRRLLAPLAAAYPHSSHVALVGLEQASDLQVWEFARVNDYVIVTQDDDFSALSALRGHPPRVIKLTLGNSHNDRVLAVLLANSQQIAERFSDPAVSMVELASTIA